MQLSDRVLQLRQDCLARGEEPVSSKLQGVTKERIAEVLRALDLHSTDRVDAVFVILNNTSYRILKQRLHNMRGLAEQADTYVGMELTDPTIDFVGLARSLGVNAERARPVHEATDILGHALKNGGPTLIDVELARAFKPM